MSSRQIDDPARGMSFGVDGPLDLRLDPASGEAASARLARAEADEVEAALREHGDVPRARALARAIVEAAREGVLRRTGDLRRVIERAHGGHAHPRRLAQVFQALRIWINDEMRDLEGMMEWLPDAVRPGGVVVTLAYHSGEDRRVKRALRGSASTASPRRLPPMAAPPVAGPWEELTRRVVVPSESETALNPRARSARLRAFRRKAA